MDSMRKCFVLLVFIAVISYMFIYISTSVSEKSSRRENLTIRNRKAISSNEQSIDGNVTRKEENDRHRNPSKSWNHIPSKTKEDDYFQSFARKVDNQVDDKIIAHMQRQKKINYTIESSKINSSVSTSIHRKEKNNTIFLDKDIFLKKESKIIKSISTKHNDKNVDIREVNHFQGKGKFESFSERRSQGNTSQGNSTYEIQTGACKVSFDEDSLNTARQLLYQSSIKSVYLFYIHLQIQNIIHFSSDYKKIDRLSNWIYALKDQKFLLKLPVDFDLVTFNLLYYDNEEEFINLKAFYSNANCTWDSIETITSTRILLWNELFNNDTMYYLCNRHYTDERERENMYNILTIWIGYDLTCSEAPTKIGTYEFDIKKDDIPLVIPIVAFLLSLQFVWIFVLLDIQSSNQNAEERKNSEKEDDHRKKSSSVYKKGDRPFGIKKIFIKLLYCDSKCCFCCHSCCCHCFCCHSAPKRVVLLIWIFIFLPFGIVRTYSRHELNTGTYKEYPHVLRTSEPMFNIIEDGTLALTLDIIYALLGPLIFIWVGACYYDAYTAKYQCCTMTCCERHCTNMKENETKDTHKFTGMSDKVVTWCNILCSSCEKDVSIGRMILRIVFGLVVGLLSFFPIICFICPFQFECFHCKNSNKDKNDMQIPSANTRNKESIPIPKHSNEEQVEMTNLKTVEDETQVEFNIPRSEDDKCRWKSVTICIINLLFFFVSYFLCLRPIFSTVTFLLRFVSYFVFVLLPIRVSMFRYTFLLVSLIVYIVRYLHEIINMNSAILDYIFEKVHEEQNDKSNSSAVQPPNNQQHNQQQHSQQNNQQQQNQKQNDNLGKQDTQQVTFETIDEKVFTYIYTKLLFVKKKFYYFFCKAFVVFVYLFVIVETFSSNTNSLTSTSFKDIVEIVLVLIGPYAISLFLKGNSGDFLTDDNKKDIYIALKPYLKSTKMKTLKSNKGNSIEETEPAGDQRGNTHKTNKGNSNDETESTGNQPRDNQNVDTQPEVNIVQPTNDLFNLESLSRRTLSAAENTNIQNDEKERLIEKKSSRKCSIQ